MVSAYPVRGRSVGFIARWRLDARVYAFAHAEPKGPRRAWIYNEDERKIKGQECVETHGDRSLSNDPRVIADFSHGARVYPQFVTISAIYPPPSSSNRFTHAENSIAIATYTRDFSFIPSPRFSTFFFGPRGNCESGAIASRKEGNNFVPPLVRVAIKVILLEISKKRLIVFLATRWNFYYFEMNHARSRAIS